MFVSITCLQWFSNTIRHVSGSAVHGLDGVTFRLFRPSGPLGVIRLSQLMFASRAKGKIFGVGLFQDRGKDPRRKREEKKKRRRKGKEKEERRGEEGKERSK